MLNSIFMRILLLLLSVTIFCGLMRGANFPSNSKQITSKSVLSSQSFPLVSNTLTMNNGIEFILQSFNAEEIHQAIMSSNQQKIISTTIKHAGLISKYVKEVYNVDCSEDEDVPDATLVFGLFCYGKEKNLGQISDSESLSQGRTAGGDVGTGLGGGDPLNCLIGAIGGIIGLGEIQVLYNDYVNGVSPTTVLKSLKVLVRRVASVFTIISAVYSFGDCLNWW
jgi:hypothetical protein